jgi:hypothetical protein
MEVLADSLEMRLEYPPQFISWMHVRPFMTGRIKPACFGNVALCHYHNGGFCLLIVSGQGKNHTIFDLQEQDINGCRWLPLSLHDLSVPAQLRPCDASIHVMEVGHQFKG